MKKVALSASFWDKPAAAELLASCDVIFTSNETWLYAIQEKFGYEKIIPIQNCTPQTRANIISLFPEGTEFVEFGDLHTLSKQEAPD